MRRGDGEPPVLPGRLLAVVVRVAGDRECILGDLEEEYHEAAAKFGRRRAEVRYWGKVLGLVAAFAAHRAAGQIRGRMAGGKDRGRRMSVVSALLQDARYTVRGWRRLPGLTLASALTVALGVGATTAIFSVANYVLVEPPHGVRDPGGIVAIQVIDTETGRPTRLSYPLFEAYRGSVTGLEDVAAFELFPATVSSGSEAEPDVVSGMVASGSYFRVLGARPYLGRFFAVEEDSVRGAHAVAVLSYRYWTTRFGADAAVVGRTVRINRVPFTVIGIAEKGFHGHVAGYDFSVWVPMAMAEAVTDLDLDSWGFHAFNTLGRMEPGRSRAEVATAAGLALERLRVSHPAELENTTLGVQPFDRILEEFEGPVVAFMALLFGLSAVILLIASVNVGGMLLSSAVSRSHEMGVRLAIGAGRGRLVRQLLTESVLLFLLGSALGAVIAWGGTRVLSVIDLPTPVPMVLDIPPDMRVLAFALVVALATGVVFGLAPALHATRSGVAATLRGAAQGEAGRRTRLRDAFVVAQVAGSVLLLVVAGLLMRGLGRVGDVNLGFSPQPLHVLDLNLSLQRYSGDAATAFYGRLRDRTGATPGVESVAFATSIPLGSSSRASVFELPGGDGAKLAADFTDVTRDYFETMGVRLVEGRPFEEREPGALRQIVVNQTAAERFWPGRSAIGERLRLGDDELEVVGVAANGRYRTIGEAPRSMVYLPLGERYPAELNMVVRLRPGAARIDRALRAIVRELDPDLPIVANASYASLIGVSLLPNRAATGVAGSFGILGMALAATGLFGVLSFTVSRRSKELGLRIALGAASGTVRRAVLRDGLRLTGVGLLVGCPLAFVAASLLPSMLFGLSPADPITYVGIAVLLSGVSLLAGHVPARRATRVDPMTALRSD